MPEFDREMLQEILYKVTAFIPQFLITLTQDVPKTVEKRVIPHRSTQKCRHRNAISCRCELRRIFLRNPRSDIPLLCGGVGIFRSREDSQQRRRGPLRSEARGRRVAELQRSCEDSLEGSLLSSLLPRAL